MDTTAEISGSKDVDHLQNENSTVQDDDYPRSLIFERISTEIQSMKRSVAQVRQLMHSNDILRDEALAALELLRNDNNNESHQNFPPSVSQTPPSKPRREKRTSYEEEHVHLRGGIRSTLSCTIWRS